jgi:hypothetical protein
VLLVDPSLVGVGSRLRDAGILRRAE